MVAFCKGRFFRLEIDDFQHKLCNSEQGIPCGMNMFQFEPLRPAQWPGEKKAHLHQGWNRSIRKTLTVYNILKWSKVCASPWNCWVWNVLPGSLVSAIEHELLQVTSSSSSWCSWRASDRKELSLGVAVGAVGALGRGFTGGCSAGTAVRCTTGTAGTAIRGTAGCATGRRLSSRMTCKEPSIWLNPQVGSVAQVGSKTSFTSAVRTSNNQGTNLAPCHVLLQPGPVHMLASAADHRHLEVDLKWRYQMSTIHNPGS